MGSSLGGSVPIDPRRDGCGNKSGPIGTPRRIRGATMAWFTRTPRAGEDVVSLHCSGRQKAFNACPRRGGFLFMFPLGGISGP